MKKAPARFAVVALLAAAALQFSACARRTPKLQRVRIVNCAVTSHEGQRLSCSCERIVEELDAKTGERILVCGGKGRK